MLWLKSMMVVQFTRVIYHMRESHDLGC